VGAVTGLQELDRPAACGSVSGHHLVAHAFDGVEQGQLRARVGPFPPDDEPGPRRVAVVVDQPGDLADLGAVT